MTQWKVGGRWCYSGSEYDCVFNKNEGVVIEVMCHYHFTVVGSELRNLVKIPKEIFINNFNPKND